MRNTFTVAVFCLLNQIAGGATATLHIANPGPSFVDAGTPVVLEVRGAFDSALVSCSFNINASGTPEVVLADRSADPLAEGGLSYISMTNQLYYYWIWVFFQNNLPFSLTTEGAFRDVLLDLHTEVDGMPPCADVLVETITIVPWGIGEATVSLSDFEAATTASVPDGAVFETASVDPARSSVAIHVLAPLECWTNPPPDAYHPDSDQDGLPDVCDRCPGHDDNTDTDGDGIPDGCDRCPGFDDRFDMDEDGAPDQCDNCPGPNPDQLDSDGDGVGDACDPQFGPLFDYDRDGDVDQSDFAQMQACYTGRDWPLTYYYPDGRCDGKDVTGDGFVTSMREGDSRLGEFEWFDRCKSGPGIPADATCGDCDGHGVLDARTNPPDPWVSDFDADGDGIQVLGRLVVCTGGSTTDCDDNCPCVANSDQTDSDLDGVGDACETQGQQMGAPQGMQGESMMLGMAEESEGGQGDNSGPPMTVDVELPGGGDEITVNPGDQFQIDLYVDTSSSSVTASAGEMRIETSQPDVLEIIGPETVAVTAKNGTIINWQYPAYSTPTWYDLRSALAYPVPIGAVTGGVNGRRSVAPLGSPVHAFGPPEDPAPYIWGRVKLATILVKVNDTLEPGTYEISGADGLFYSNGQTFSSTPGPGTISLTVESP